MIQNLVWAKGYNFVAIPLAVGALYAWCVLLTLALGAVLMAASTVIVDIIARLLRLKAKPQPEAKNDKAVKNNHQTQKTRSTSMLSKAQKPKGYKLHRLDGEIETVNQIHYDTQNGWPEKKSWFHRNRSRIRLPGSIPGEARARKIFLACVTYSVWRIEGATLERTVPSRAELASGGATP